MLIFFIIVFTAYQVLGDSSERARYDKNRKAYKLREELNLIDLWDEEFAKNASGTNSEPESDGDDNKEEGEEIKPDSFRLRIYKEATP
jgi:curved DNA-binding protein CbpA